MATTRGPRQKKVNLLKLSCGRSAALQCKCPLCTLVLQQHVAAGVSVCCSALCHAGLFCFHALEVPLPEPCRLSSWRHAGVQPAWLTCSKLTDPGGLPLSLPLAKKCLIIHLVARCLPDASWLCSRGFFTLCCSPVVLLFVDDRWDNVERGAGDKKSAKNLLPLE